MGQSVRGRHQPVAQTMVAHLMRSRVAVELLAWLPIPLFLVRSVLRRDNALENRKEGGRRPRRLHEAARYLAFQAAGRTHSTSG